MDNHNHNTNHTINPLMTVQIREVWSDNADYEFSLIRSLIDSYPYVSLDTEFPGVLFRRSDGGDRSTSAFTPETNYAILKRNVDVLKMIQLGLTLTDSAGNLPDLGTGKEGFIWQFNFCDFDPARDSHAADSVELLRNNGIDFEKNLRLGVDSVRFSELMMSSGLVCNGDCVTFVTFHCAYDFGYLIKVLTQRELPGGLPEFLTLVKVFFGESVFDVKYMIKYCNGLYGGLERVARVLELGREVGQSHQAGSDSLLTWRVFQRVRDVHFGSKGGGVGIGKCAGLLYGLENS